MGQLPKHNATRSQAAITGVVILPRNGYDGPIPEWPLAPLEGDEGAFLANPSPREAVLWVRLWRLPQATAWDQYHMHLAVARYCRTLALSEIDPANTSIANTCSRLESDIGLNPRGMRALLWVIESKRASSPSETSEDGASGAKVISMAERVAGLDFEAENGV